MKKILKALIVLGVIGLNIVAVDTGFTKKQSTEPVPVAKPARIQLTEMRPLILPSVLKF